jgi:hypothetical protein
MSIMLTEIYDALKDAGASEDKSRQAAEAVAAYDSRVGDLKGELGAFRSEMHGELGAFRSEMRGELAAFRSEVRGEMALMKWMLGFVLAMLAALVLKNFL